MESFEEMACAFVVRTFAATMLAAGACVLASAFSSVRAESDDIRIAHIYSKTGPLESFARQNHDGLMMGLSYATEGTNEGRRQEDRHDREGRPGEAGRGEGRVGDSLWRRQGRHRRGADGIKCRNAAMTGAAEEYKKILLIENAVADVLTGAKWNKYLFRTIRSSSQDAIGNAIALDSDGVSIATLAQDFAYGKDGVKAFREALKKAKVVHQEFLPSDTSDFTAVDSASSTSSRICPVERSFSSFGREPTTLQDRRSRSQTL